MRYQAALRPDNNGLFDSKLSYKAASDAFRYAWKIATVPHVHFVRLPYVILDIRDRGTDAKQAAGLAERRGEDAPFQCRSGISVA